MTSVKFPEMRAEVVAALMALADRKHQERRWGVAEQGVNYYDDLTLNVNILYDDCQVLPEPSAALGTVLHATELEALRGLNAVLTPMLDELGDRPDREYTSDPRWQSVVSAAQVALEAMRQAE